MAGSESTAAAVVVCLNGGLGNQLFQYAMGRALSLRNGLPLILDLASFDYLRNQGGAVDTVRSYALEPFRLNVRTQCIGLPLPKTPGFIGRVLRRIFRHLLRQQMGKRIYREKGYAFDPVVYALQGPVWLEGYWQSHRYFEDFADVLREELAQPHNISDATRETLVKIRQADAICLHIRRGDYVTNRYAAATHGLCGLDYYAKGLEVVLPGLKNPHCFVFSDDPEWVRNNLKVTVPMTIVDINGPDSAHEDLWLMSACKRFIIANSSLSWWGAWLSGSQDKLVVAPLKWFVDSSKDTSDLIPAEWVRL